MTITPGDPTTSVIDLAQTLRPQRFGPRSVKKIADPVVEPQWAGIRVIASAQDGAAAMFDDGEAVPHDEVSRALGAMLWRTTGSAILDGYLTKQAHPQETPVATGLEEAPSSTELFTQTFFGLKLGKRAAETRRREAEARASYIRPDDRVTLLATDLLYLDGTWLLDVPLLERRRLLESVLPGDELVRPGPYVRPPIDSWLTSWRAQGFTGITFKDANSRYVPGGTAMEWATAPMPSR